LAALKLSYVVTSETEKVQANIKLEAKGVRKAISASNLVFRFCVLETHNIWVRPHVGEHLQDAFFHLFLLKMVPTWWNYVPLSLYNFYLECYSPMSIKNTKSQNVVFIKHAFTLASQSTLLSNFHRIACCSSSFFIFANEIIQLVNKFDCASFV